MVPPYKQKEKIIPLFYKQNKTNIKTKKRLKENLTCAYSEKLKFIKAFLS